MSTNYPGSLDQFTTKLFGETIVASHVNDLQDAVEAMQTKIGIGIVGVSIGATNSLDWFLRSPSSTSPGHKHVSGDISGGLAEADITRPGSPILARIAQSEIITGSWTFSGTGGLKVTGGYSMAAMQASHLTIGAGGSGANAVSFNWGNNTGICLHFGTTVASVFTPRVTMLDSGRVGIGTQSPYTPLHVQNPNTEANWTANLAGDKGALTISGPGSWVSMSVHDTTTGAMALRFITEKVGVWPSNFIFAPGSAQTGAFTLERIWYYQGITGYSYLPGAVLVNISNLPFAGGVDERGRGYFAAYFYDNAYGANVFLCGGRGTSTPFAGGTPAPPLSDDQLGAVIFGGNSATGGTPAFRSSASVEAIADGTWSDTSWPASLNFFTTPRDSTSGRMERAKITRGGNFVLGGPGSDSSLFPYGQLPGTSGPLILFANTQTVKIVFYRSGSTLATDSFGIFVDPNTLRYAVGTTGTNVHAFEVGSTRVMTIGVDTLRAERGFATARGDISLVNGTNNNVNAQGRSYLKISGPTLSYTITGFSGGVDGQRLVVQNGVAQNLTFNHADAGSLAANRLYLFGGGTLTLTGTGTGAGGSAEFIYDAGSSTWVLLTARQAGTSGGTPK